MACLSKRGAALVFCLLIFLTMQIFSEEQNPKKTDKSSYTYSVNVGLVVLPVTVLDKSGRAISGLTQEDFEIYEDGVLQNIQVFDQKDIPVGMGLIVDNSTSMIPKRAEVAAAALALAESSNPEDQIFVVHFQELVVFALRLGEAFTSDIEELRKAVSSAAGSGRTALYDAVIAGLEHVQQSDLPKRVLVVISDGGDNASSHSMKEALDTAIESNALIYSIGIYDEFDREHNPKALKQLASMTGGEAFFPRSLSQLSSICTRIATDIRSQYTLGYVPSNQNKDGSYRSIRFVLKARDKNKLTVRTRSGYRAPGGEPGIPDKDSSNAGS
jgi:Ca-activated chloride channel homolog